jgi:hypothetical protein
MKKHPEADALATRLAVAASQPVAVLPFPAPPSAEPETAPPPPESEATSTDAAEAKDRRRRKARTRATPVDQPEDDTVPITLRPRREVWTRYVLPASERTRETGRVVSGQEIILERLEDGP